MAPNGPGFRPRFTPSRPRGNHSHAGPSGTHEGVDLGTTCMSGNRQLVDTNIRVYAHDVTAGDKHSRARALVEELWVPGKDA